MSNAIVTINDANFSAEVTDCVSPVLVDFWAPWCGPCRMIAPILDELANEYQGRLKIAKINVDDNPEMAAKYTVRAIPTLLLFKQGQLVATKTGMLAKKQMVDFLESNL